MIFNVYEVHFSLVILMVIIHMIWYYLSDRESQIDFIKESKSSLSQLDILPKDIVYIIFVIIFMIPMFVEVFCIKVYFFSKEEDKNNNL